MSVNPPSLVVTVMVAVPSPTPSMRPSPMTLTTLESLDVHVVYTSGADVGETVYSSCKDDPNGNANVSKAISTLVTLPC